MKPAGLLLVILLTIGQASMVLAAQAEPAPQLRNGGGWMVDQHGRVVLLHGVNLVWKNEPFVPPDAPAGFTVADADWLAAHGLNSARIGTLWEGVSPRAPGEIEHEYLDAWERVVRLLADRQIWMLFDFHQDMLAPIYQGGGVPEWAVLPGPTTDLLGPPAFGFPFNYFTPQVSEAYDNLWAEQGPVWDGYRDAWMAVARRWRDQPYSMGYDLLNEPWAGLEWPTCLVPGIGCPNVDADELQPFFEHAIDGIRTVDPDNLVWLEPQLLAGGTAAPTGFGPMAGEDQLGYSFHNYCPHSAFSQAAELGLIEAAPELGDTCHPFEAEVVAQALQTAGRMEAVALMTEFGATDDLGLLRRVTAIADDLLVGWQYWAYKEWEDPTTQAQGSGAQGLFTDDADLSTLKQDKARVLVRTYPWATAGTPLELSFDPDTGDFRYVYEAADHAVPTEIFVSPVHYDGCWQVDVVGGRVVSTDGARVVEVAADPGTEVTVIVTAATGCVSIPSPDDDVDGGETEPGDRPDAPLPATGSAIPIGLVAMALAALAARRRRMVGEGRMRHSRSTRPTTDDVMSPGPSASGAGSSALGRTPRTPAASAVSRRRRRGTRTRRLRPSCDRR